MPAAAQLPRMKRGTLMGVVIGVDPHKGSHTAVAIDEAEKVLGRAQGALVAGPG